MAKKPYYKHLFYLWCLLHWKCMSEERFFEDMRQWECISYCLSQLSFTDKRIRKLIESFKAYEHILSEDIVIDHFRNIINKANKFAKPELKLSIEEFEEKIDKFHNEKKEQVLIEKNAQAYQQRVKNMGSFVATKKDEEESGDSEITEDEVEIDNSEEDIKIPHSKSLATKSRTSPEASS